MLDGYFCAMSTVAEIKQAFARLPDRQKIRVARWLQTQVDDRPNDEELMKLAAEGARLWPLMILLPPAPPR